MMKENLVAMIEESLKSNWHLPAFSNYKEQEYSFEKVAKKILWLHFIFEKKKIKKGDKIAVIGKNSVNWAITYLATISYGAVIVPILPDFAPDDIHHIVNHSEASLLFSAEDIYEDIDEQKMPNLNVIFSLSDFSVLFDKKNTMSSILEKAVSETKTFQLLAASEFQLPKIDNNSLASIVYTSGTTGFSKGVMLSHNNLVANIVYAQNNMSLKAGDNIVSFMPLAHSYGCAFEFLFPFTLGCHITFLSKIPSPKIIVKAFKEIKPQLVLSVPLIMEKIYKKQIKPQIDKPLIKIMLKIPLVNRIIYKKIYEKLYDSFGGNFHEIVIGGAALNKEVEQFLKKLNFPFTIGYGMTECAPLISYAPWKTHKPKSVGKVVDTKTKAIVGFTAGSSFDVAASEAVGELRSFLFIADEGTTESYGRSLKEAVLALGYGDSYEEEWGDCRYLLGLLRESPRSVRVVERHYSESPHEQLEAVLGEGPWFAGHRFGLSPASVLQANLAAAVSVSPSPPGSTSSVLAEVTT